MPLTYSISPFHHLLFIRGEGVIDQPERVRVLRAWLDDPDYGSCDTALCDVSGVESLPTMAELREMVAIIAAAKSGRGPRKLAIVTGKPITFGVAREFKDFVAIAGVDMEVRVFDAVGEAWGWLLPDQPRTVESQ
jgi:hypothetical protein